jgi:acyl-CoA synthetase (AMP-forming)/AMP-acid ligase II
MRAPGGKRLLRNDWNRTRNRQFGNPSNRKSEMGTATFVIAILGCADGGTACTPVATLQTRYESEAQCSAATVPALEQNSNFDYPTLVARCRRASAPVSANEQHPRVIPASARRG